MRITKKNQEMKVYGRHAVLSLFKNRPLDVIKVYITREGVFTFKELIRHCVDYKLAYHIVESSEIENLAKATHHEDVLVIAKIPTAPNLKDMLNTQGRNIIVALEEVSNPHNLGAIMRSCAHYGVSGIIYEAKVPVANSASAVRTAEGGAEYVSAVHIDNWNEVFDQAKMKGYKIIATSSHQGDSLFKTKFPEKTILLLGAEGPGLSEKLMKKVDSYLSIPGTGNVESLNVSNANVAILTEWYRQGL